MPDDYPDELRLTFISYLADVCRLSVRTMRNVLKNRPVTYGTACRIVRATGCPMAAIRIKQDKRGRPSAGGFPVSSAKKRGKRAGISDLLDDME